MSTQALVIGGSMAGLMAARFLSEHFDTVTIIERDKLPDGPDFRSGVPQGRHVHALLALGEHLMAEMFPGLLQDLDEIGAVNYQWGLDTAYLTAGGWIKRFDMGVTTRLMTRVALEYLIRRRLAMRGNVTFLTEQDVQCLLTDESRGKVTGVQTESRKDHTTQAIYGDLVVDASGRTSKTPEWLQAIGYTAPEETTVYAYIGYATRLYEVPAENKPDWKVLFLNGRPAQGLCRGGAIFEVEGNQWIATLGGLNRDYPPTDEAGFLEYAKTLASSAFYEAIKDAKPLSPIYGYRYEGNRLRHYEQLERRPENFIVLGDALCGFNPLYGQGMTIAALEAVHLGKMLAGRDVRNLAGFAEAFQKHAAHLVQNAWLMATGEDLRYPGTEGLKPNLIARFIQRYIDRVLVTLPNDEEVTRAFMDVSNLIKPPNTLFAPRILLRVLRHAGNGATHEVPHVPSRPAALASR